MAMAICQAKKPMRKMVNICSLYSRRTHVGHIDERETPSCLIVDHIRWIAIAVLQTMPSMEASKKRTESLKAAHQICMTSIVAELSHDRVCESLAIGFPHHDQVPARVVTSNASENLDRKGNGIVFPDLRVPAR
jgi:hypothetical protein